MTTLEEVQLQKVRRSMSMLKFNEKQQEAWNLMVNKKNVFITGAGGVGKTCLVKMFTRAYKNTRNIAVTSTTGTSAILINGVTTYSYLGIGTGKNSVNAMYAKISKKKVLMDKWINLECLIIDEISMMCPLVWDKIEELGRKIRRSQRPFGGIQLIVAGDFLQLPVVTSDNFCFESESWSKCMDNVVYLTEIIRQTAGDFQILLNEVRLGKLSNKSYGMLKSRLGAKITNAWGIKPTRLYSTNNDVDRINEQELDKLAAQGAEFYEYEMDIYTYPGVNRQYVTEKFKKYCNAQPKLQLCVGAQVMLLTNLDTQNGLSNGSRGVITRFVDDMPEVRFFSGVERVIVPHTWEVEEFDKNLLRAQQIPLRIAYAISIHKSQGCTLDCAEIDLYHVFEYGQTYVALSRLRTLEGLSLNGLDFSKIMAHPKALRYYDTLGQ